MKTKTILFSILLAFCTHQLLAVEIFSRKLYTSNGLPDNNVRNLAQDSKGFLWLGTPDGLYRFDGYFFTHYKHIPGEGQDGLENNHVTGCYALSDGRMLFSERGGVYSVFDINTNRFVHLPTAEKERLYQQARQRTGDERLLKPHKDILAAGGNYINDNLGNIIVIDKVGRIWFIDRKTGETIHMNVFDEQLFPMVSSPKFKVMTSEKKGLIWVSTNGCGITVYDRNTHEERHIRATSGLISTDYIQDICLDHHDNIWAADEFHGIVYLATEPSQAETHLLQPDSKELRSNQVYIMRWTDDSTLLVANTKGDVYEADRQFRLRQTMKGIDIHSICTDRKGSVWMGSRRLGFRSPDGEWHRHDPHNTATPSADNIAALMCDRNGRIWMACEDAQLDLIDRATLRVSHFLPQGASPKVIMQDHQGVIWVGTQTGLYSFIPEELLKNPKAYTTRLTAQETEHSDINCIYEDSSHRLWIGTSGNGIYWTADGGQSFNRLTTANGLVSNEIQSIIEADRHTLWFATKKGITCYRPEDDHYHYIYNGRNLLQNYYADNCVCLIDSCRIAFGTNQGIVVFDRKDSHTATGDTRLAITDLLINGISVSQMGNDSPLSASPDDTESIDLSHDQNSISIRFSAFNFGMAAGTRYTYMLEGYDRAWSELSEYSFADYKNLPPGRYVLHVKAYDSHAGSEMERQLVIIIRHPWWLTWWACLAYLAIAAVVGYVIYRQVRRTALLRQSIAVEKQLTEYKLRFFTNISHEFRTPLTIIRGAMERIRSVGELPANLRQPVSSMQKSTDRMLRLINQLLEFRKMQNDKLRLALEETDVVAFVKDICQNFTGLAENKRIAYTFLPNVKSFQTFVDRQHIDKIVYNLLSNAFKYTPTGGDITVSLRIGNGQFSLSVADSGVGIPKERQAGLFERYMQSSFSNDSNGIGLHLTKALVDIHKGTIRYEENRPQGSVFTVEIPTDRSTYSDDDFLRQSALSTAQQAPNVTKEEYREVTAGPMNECTVLIVDDDSDVLDFLRQTLQPYFNVATAMDGAEALHAVEEHLPDLIVSDVIMPVMDGYELTQRLRSNKATQHLPIVLLTALSDEDKRIKGATQGADAYLTKPFDTRLLIATCAQLLEQRGRLRQSYADSTAEPQSALPPVITEERDKHFLDLLSMRIDSQIRNAAFSVDTLAVDMGFSRTAFFKKVKALTGQTPAEYIRDRRLGRAAEMLREETVTVAEVAYAVGISDPHYFTKVFKQRYGISPKQYQKGTQAKDI